MTGNEKAYRTLEFDKVRALLSANAVCEGAKEKCITLTPIFNIEKVNKALEETDDAVFLLGKKGAPALSSVKNVNASLLRAQKGASLTLRELLDIAKVLTTTAKLLDYRDDAVASRHIVRYFNSLVPDKYLQSKIERSIISDDEISDSASSTLADIRRKINRAIAKAKEILSGMIKSPTYQRFLQEPIVTMRGDRYVVPVKAEFRGEIKGLVHDISGSGSTLFVEPMGVVEANNELRVLKSQEQDEIDRIIAELSAEVAEASDKIKNNYELIVILDFIFAKAKLAYKQKAFRPIVNDKGFVNIINGRHPLIDKNKVVPVSVSLGGDFDLLVITGPNTGGKTVSLKMTGLFTLMMQSGLFVPFDEGSSLAVFKNIFADIGDEQSIEQSLSTFSSHMTNIVDITKKADADSLVLIDELGAGTDPVEGAALAIAILEYIRSFGAKIVATTHYAELKNYAVQTPRVENAGCEFDVKTLRPTYKLLVGIPGKSNAFAISQRIGLDDAIIDAARGYVSKEGSDFEKIVSDLEAKRQEMERQREASADLEYKLRIDRAKLDEQMEKFSAEKDKEVLKARQEAKRILSRAKRLYEDMAEEFDELKRQKDAEDFAKKVNESKSKLRGKLSQLDDTVDPVDKQETYELPRQLALGDTVEIPSMNKHATVLSMPDTKGEITVQMGSIKVKVPLKNVKLVEDVRKKPPVSNVRKPQKSGLDTAVMELDLRGKMVDEAVIELDKFLDNAAMTGIGSVRVIHGKGTGALRAGVSNFLENHPHVRSFRLGVYGEGESGVTIVEIK